MFVVRKLSVFGMILFLNGCGLALFTPPKENPIIEDKIGPKDMPFFRTMSTTAERRIVIVKTLQGNKYGKYCAEPSPDAADNLASSFAAYLKGSGSNGAVNIEADTGVEKRLATTVFQLGTRSQGLQFFRDGSYSLCLAYLNDIITGAEYITKLKELTDDSKALIDTELRYKGSLKIPEAKTALTTKQIQDAVRAEILAETESKTAIQTALLKKTTDQAAIQKLKDDAATEKVAADLLRKSKANDAKLAEKQSANALLEEQQRYDLKALENKLNALQKNKEIKVLEDELNSN